MKRCKVSSAASWEPAHVNLENVEEFLHFLIERPAKTQRRRVSLWKESDLKFNRTINCVCWYLEFTLEKLPWVENHKTLIDHFVRSQIQKFLYHTRTGANSPATIHQVNSSLSFLFPSLIWEYHQRFNAQGFTSYNMYVVLFDFFYNSFN